MGEDGDYVLPKDVVGKPAHWFVFGEEGDLRFRSRENWNGDPVPEKKFLLARHEATYFNPYGMAELSRCFWPVTFKRGGLKFWVVFTEKYGMPFLIGKHPRGTEPSENDRLLDMLERMIQDAVAVIPDDSSVEFVESGRGGQASSSEIYKSLIETCKGEISISILGQNLTTEVKEGSFAASQSHMAVRQDIVDSDRKLVERTLNELIGWVYEYNFGPTRSAGAPEQPVFSMWEDEDVDKTLADRDKILSETGVRFSKAYYMRAYGFEEGDFEVGVQAKGGSFAEGGEGKTFPDQQRIDDFVDGLTAEELQRQVETVLKPVLDLISGSQDYQAVMEGLAGRYPEMDAKELEEMLARAIFVSELWGRMSAEKEA